RRTTAPHSAARLIFLNSNECSENTKAVATVVVPKSSSATDMQLVNSMAASARAYALANNGNAPAGYVVAGDGPVVGGKEHCHDERRKGEIEPGEQGSPWRRPKAGH